METPSKSETHKCSVCSKDANLICKACKGTPDGVGGLVAIYYCGAKCQRDGWSAHKSSCRAAKDRRALYRAGDIALQLYQILHRNTWKWPIEKIQRNDNKWHVYNGIYTGKSVVLPFPSAMFPNAKDQEAILSHSGCNAAIAHVHNPIRDLLKGKGRFMFHIRGRGYVHLAEQITVIYSEIDEVTVRIKNPSLRIISRDGPMLDEREMVFDFRKPLHNVLRVTLSNGEVYALDMTGPQFGWHGSSILPWSAFVKDRVDNIKEIRNFGETARIIREEAQVTGVARINIHHINEQIELHLNHHLKQWQKDNVSLKAMLRWSEEDFKPKQDLLLRFMGDRMLEVRIYALKTGFFDILTGKPLKR